MRERPNKGLPWGDNEIWSKLIEKSKQDLENREDRELTLEAAKYFFVKPVKNDEYDITTFTGLMLASRINPDKAAEKIFNDLSRLDKRRVCLLLRNAKFHVCPSLLKTDKFIN